MKDDEIRARFDGRGRVELIPEGHVTAAKRRHLENIAHALGYRLLDNQNTGLGRGLFLFERDDGPQARRRNELTVARLREGGPLLPVGPPEPPPPPPPGPPPAPSQPRPRRYGRPASGPPPPAPPRPRHPPMPPGPPPSPPNTPAS
ncbi:hypothetical protein ACFTTN_21335 [Streptomyces niveus]|uniref:hypothetical protein n=1 Tax=Streptomyces niveus TaxID=193462 RepID=UPI00363A36AC